MNSLDDVGKRRYGATAEIFQTPPKDLSALVQYGVLIDARGRVAVASKRDNLDRKAFK